VPLCISGLLEMLVPNMMYLYFKLGDPKAITNYYAISQHSRTARRSGLKVSVLRSGDIFYLFLSAGCHVWRVWRFYTVPYCTCVRLDCVGVRACCSNVHTFLNSSGCWTQVLGDEMSPRRRKKALLAGCWPNQRTQILNF
jgi:hypothetical protein